MTSSDSSCHFTSFTPAPHVLYQHVEPLWQMDVFPFRSEKQKVRSRLDKEAIQTLEMHTERVKVHGTFHYATPLLRVKGAPPLKATPTAAMPLLRRTERRLKGDPVQANSNMKTRSGSSSMQDTSSNSVTMRYKPQRSHGLYPNTFQTSHALFGTVPLFTTTIQSPWHHHPIYDKSESPGAKVMGEEEKLG